MSTRSYNQYSKEDAINIGSYDRQILMLYYILVLTGWMMIYTVHYQPNSPTSIFDLTAEPGKQFMFIVICTVLLTFIAFTNSAMWKILSVAFYGLGILLLVLVLFFGVEVNGANAWFRIGSFGFQPAEFAKFATAMAVANIMSASNVTFRDRKIRMYVAGLIFLPIALIMLQPDTGSALVFTAFLVPLYREGMNPALLVVVFCMAILVILGLIFPPSYVCAFLLIGFAVFVASRQRLNLGVLAIAVGLAVLAFFWKATVFPWLAGLAAKPDMTQGQGEYVYFSIAALFLAVIVGSYFLNTKSGPEKRNMQLSLFILSLASALVFFAQYVCFTVLAPHQQERIKVWLRPQECDPRGSLYNILHSKMAIASGGFSGKGFLEGNMTKLKYVPMQNTDFIFCTISEEQGFIGVTATLLLFALLVYRILIVAERSRSNFTRIYGYTIAGIFLVHFVVNTGMTMGLFPIIGIPLPFMSYGGSSLIGFTLLIGVFLKLARGN